MSVPLGGPEVTAQAMMHVYGPGATLSAVLLIQLRPQAIAPRRQADMMARAFEDRLRSGNWINPAPLLAGDQIDIPAQLPVEGAIGTGPITVTGLGEVMYEGPLNRPPGWTDIARATSTLLLLAGADPTLDDRLTPATQDPLDFDTGDTLRQEIQRLAARGKLLAARGIIPTVNPFIRPRTSR